MARFAVIKDGVVVNHALADDADFAAEQGWVPAADAAMGDLWDGEVFTPAPPAPLLARQAAVWERVKAERERRRTGGVKVGAHWFHSDDASRIQQLALAIMGQAVPAVQWKTLTLAPTAVFVTMTPALAQGIFQATAASDTAIFAAAEAHREAMEASTEPESYDFSGNWPPAIWDEVE
ncbi:MAG TPA: DUF4376 domain-containing protein [Ottowia sp.]|nr:DUF4376 domain-containing protein [Ottowia sp.]